MKKPQSSLPELVSKQREAFMIQEFGIQIKREDIEGQTEEHIKPIIEELLTKLSLGVLKQALIFKKRWEEETLREAKFLGKDN